MAVALGVLGFAPAVLWAMTPRELDAALTGRFGRASRVGVMQAEELRALMRRFPDQGVSQ